MTDWFALFVVSIILISLVAYWILTWSEIQLSKWHFIVYGLWVGSVATEAILVDLYPDYFFGVGLVMGIILSFTMKRIAVWRIVSIVMLIMTVMVFFLPDILGG